MGAIVTEMAGYTLYLFNKSNGCASVLLKMAAILVKAYSKV